MLDRVGCIDFIEGVVRKRVRQLVQIMNQVHARQRDAVNSDGPRPLVLSATDVQCLFHGLSCFRPAQIIRHRFSATVSPCLNPVSPR